MAQVMSDTMTSNSVRCGCRGLLWLMIALAVFFVSPCPTSVLHRATSDLPFACRGIFAGQHITSSLLSKGFTFDEKSREGFAAQLAACVSTQAAQRETEAERRQKEAALSEIARLKALLLGAEKSKSF